MAKFAKSKTKTKDTGKTAKVTKTKTEKPKQKVTVKKATATPTNGDARKIKVIAKQNPKREGSAAYDRFELYSGAKTVEDFIAAGGTKADLRHDENAGFIQVS